MSGADVLGAVSQLTQAEPATADREMLTELVRRSQQVRSWLDALDARIARRADELARDGACEPADTMMAGGGRR